MVRGPGIKGIAVEKGGRPEAWTGIKEGDRVVVVGKGVRDWGKVGVVREVRANQGQCAVEGVNLVCLVPPIHTCSSDSQPPSHGLSLDDNDQTNSNQNKRPTSKPRAPPSQKTPKNAPSTLSPPSSPSPPSASSTLFPPATIPPPPPSTP